MKKDASGKDSMYWKVYLDGKELDKCVHADEEEGFVIVVDGLVGNNWKYKRIEGKVKLVRIE